MFKLLYLLVPGLLLSQPATAEIFRCERENGKTIYQNFRCDIDSMGSAATAPTPAAANTGAPPAPPGAPVPGRLTRAEGGTHGAVTSTATKLEPRVGMTPRQVRRLSWGEPADISYADTAEGRIQTWVYPDKRTIRFDINGRVAAIE